MLKKVAVGIDPGARFIKLAKVRRRGSLLVIERLLKVPRDTPEETLKNFIRRMRETDFTAGDAVVGVSGRGAILRYTHVPPVPDSRLKLIMEYEMAELAGKSAESVSSDYRLLNIPTDLHQDFTVLVAMSRDNYVTEIMDFLREAGIRVRSVLPGPVALYNTFLALCQFEENKTYLAADIGAENTEVAVISGRNLYFARNIGKGADEFTEAISSALRIQSYEAEKIKVSEGAIKRTGWAGDRERLISESLAQAADRFYSVINSTLGFAKTQLKLKDLKIDRVFLFGGGAALPGLSDHLTDSFGVPVTVPDLLVHRSESEELRAIDRRLRLGDTLPPEDFAAVTANLSEFACAVGLAVSELDSTFIALDIMPTALKKKREFSHKTVFLYAAAMACAVFLITRFAGAVSESWTTAARNEKLQQIAMDCENRLARFRETKAENEKIENTLSAAVGLADAGSFATNLLFLLRKTEVVPHQVRIEEFALRRDNATRDVWATLKGEVVTERGNEFAILRQLRENLKNQKLIKDAVIDPSKTQELQGRFFFEITVTARSQM
jgi:type IV pilus assembly protein PilM